MGRFICDRCYVKYKMLVSVDDILGWARIKKKRPVNRLTANIDYW